MIAKITLLCRVQNCKLEPELIKQAVEGSLKRLRVEVIDLLCQHNFIQPVFSYHRYAISQNKI